MTRITVVIPTFRRPKMLARAVCSVLQQSFRDFELRIYDNASNDETSELVDLFVRRDSRVKYFRHPHNIGWLENFRYGMSQVDAPYFTLLGDDDFLFPTFFADAIAKFEQLPGIGMYVATSVRSDVQQIVREIPALHWRRGRLEPPTGVFEILKHHHSDLPGMMFSSQVIGKLGVFDAKAGIATDLDYQLKIAAMFPIFVSHKPGGVFFLHASQSSNRDHGIRPFWPGYRVISANLDRLECIPSDDRQRAQRLLWARTRRLLFFRGCRAAGSGSSLQALRAASVLSKETRSPLRARVLRVIVAACGWRLLRTFAMISSRVARKYMYAGYRKRLSPQQARCLGEKVGTLERLLEDEVYKETGLRVDIQSVRQ